MRTLWIAGLAALVAGGGIAAALVLTLGGGGAKSEVVGSVVLDQPLAGASVQLSTGARATTGSDGFFLLSTHIPRAFSITATGGAASGQLSGVKLSADFAGVDPAADVFRVNVLTTIVSRYRQAHPGVTIAQADARLRKALSLPTSLDPGLEQAIVDPWFSSRRFLDAAARSGGFDALVSRVVDGMAQDRAVGRYPPTAANPAGTTAAGWIAGKLMEGAGSGAASYVVGNLMSRAGLDPTANELKEINSKLAGLGQQLTTLQGTTDKVLGELLQEKFQNKLTHLPFTSIRTMTSDLLDYNQATDETTRRALRNKVLRGAQGFGAAVHAFNDVLDPGTPGTLSVIQLFAKTTLLNRRFWTIGGQRETERVFDYLDAMQVAAANAYIEYLSLAAPADQDPAVTQKEKELEARDLRTQRAAQIVRNSIPVTLPDSGVIDAEEKLLIRDSPVNVQYPYGIHGYSAWVRWTPPKEPVLPFAVQLSSIVRPRGSATVRSFLADKLGLEEAMRGVPESGQKAGLWTRTRHFSSGPHGCGTYSDGVPSCLYALSTNDATSRPLRVLDHDLFVLLVSPADPKLYSYLWS